MKDQLMQALTSSLQYLERTTSCLQASDGSFRPTEDALTAAQQLAHIGQSTEWLIDGAFSPTGFDMSFAGNLELLEKIESLEEAREILRAAYAKAMERVQSASDEEWNAPLPEGPIMGGLPRHTIIPVIVEHTAHHRGALSVYARLCGHTPAMPYA